MLNDQLASSIEKISQRAFTIRCLTNSSSFYASFDEEHSQDSASLVEKYQEFVDEFCALLVVLVDEGAALSGDAVHFRCVACKPGYAANFQGLASRSFQEYEFVKQEGGRAGCARIPNCVGEFWFNLCSRCAAGYVYKMLNDDSVSYGECVEFSEFEFCYAVKQDPSTQKFLCQLCDFGYNFNSEGRCEAMQPAKCQNSKFFIRQTHHRPQQHLYFSRYAQRGLGCASCETNHTGVKLARPVQACVFSNLLKDGFLSYVAHCERYRNDGANKECAGCVLPYIPTAGVNRENQCVVVNFCELASNTIGECLECKAGFGLVQRKCKKGTIQNCALYNSKENQSSIRCLACLEKFYLQDNECFEGQVLNCLVYQESSGNNCTRCESGYALVHQNNFDYCYPLPQQLNCAQAILSNHAVYGGQFQCTQCNDPD